ncbi:MAG: phosphoribosylglycinamide formyltransferase [Verrucomicrobia bacterium]|nr:phosphoribosylglycinamide formyltransferase [Verrucomicrobiota bacterium]
MSTRVRLGILGSGKGSNFQAIIEKIARRELAAEIGLVLSDVADSGILKIARENNIPARWVDPGHYRYRLAPEVEQEVVRELREAKVDWIVLAGFMRIVKAPLLTAYPRRIVNIHPSLLPKYPGLEAWKQALAAGETETGCTVHYVEAGIDTGETIAQKKVPILPGDTPEILHARIQAAEHQLLPEVIAGLGNRAHS